MTSEEQQLEARTTNLFHFALPPCCDCCACINIFSIKKNSSSSTSLILYFFFFYFKRARRTIPFNQANQTETKCCSGPSQLFLYTCVRRHHLSYDNRLPEEANTAM